MDTLRAPKEKEYSIFRVYNENHPESLAFKPPKVVSKDELYETGLTFTPKFELQLRSEAKNLIDPTFGSVVRRLVEEGVISQSEEDMMLITDVNDLLKQHDYIGAEYLLGRHLTEEEINEQLVRELRQPKKTEEEIAKAELNKEERKEKLKSDRAAKAAHLAALKALADARRAAAAGVPMAPPLLGSFAPAPRGSSGPAFVGAPGPISSMWPPSGSSIPIHLRSPLPASGSSTAAVSASSSPPGSPIFGSFGSPAAAASGSETPQQYYDRLLQMKKDTYAIRKQFEKLPAKGSGSGSSQAEWARIKGFLDSYPNIPYVQALKANHPSRSVVAKALGAADDDMANQVARALIAVGRAGPAIAGQGLGGVPLFTKTRQVPEDWVEFGPRYYINKKKLDTTGEFSLVHPRSGCKPNLIRNVVLTPPLKACIQAYISGDRMETMELTDKEREWLKWIWVQSKLNKPKEGDLKILPNKYVSKKVGRERIKVLMGQLQAGNTNPTLLDDLKAMTEKMSAKNFLKGDELQNLMLFISSF